MEPASSQSPQSDLLKFSQDLRQSAKNLRYRFCIVLSGKKLWGIQSLLTFIQLFRKKNTVFVSNQANPITNNQEWITLDFKDCRKYLGQELDLVIIDCHSGFDPDAVGAISGTIRAGGFLILLTPEFSIWPYQQDPQFEAKIPFAAKLENGSFYIKRLIRIIKQSDDCYMISENSKLPEILLDTLRARSVDYSDQNQAVAAITKVMSGQRRRPVILISDRGRGKSAALGIAAKELYSNEFKQIAVTGLNRASIEKVFKHAGKPVKNEKSFLKFIPADILLNKALNIDLLLIDEAATLPISVLEKLIQKYSRIAIASTVHGYEGTGRGFLNNFFKILDENSRGWKKINLQLPIRWDKDDPLEKFLYETLLLNCTPNSAESKLDTQKQLEIKPIKKEALYHNELLIREIFSLLLHAHYRTRPSDLKYLLDAPNLEIHTASLKNQLIGVLIVSIEGGFKPKLANKIWTNTIRPTGHLIPETLASQLGYEEGARQTTARIVRISVHPKFQRNGVGSQLLKFAIDKYKNLDTLSASFGATMSLIRFWKKNGFMPIRMGLSQNKRTGCASAALLKPVSKNGIALFARAQNKFRKEYPVYLARDFNQPDPMLIREIYSTFTGMEKSASFTEEELSELVGIGFANRNMDNCQFIMRKFTELSLIHI